MCTTNPCSGGSGANGASDCRGRVPVHILQGHHRFSGEHRWRGSHSVRCRVQWHLDFLGAGDCKAAGERLVLPQAVSPGDRISLVLRSSGTTIQPGWHVATGTLSSSAGDEPFIANLQVTLGSLRIVALPQTLPHVILEAGMPLSRHLTVYNVRDDGQAQWSIGNCTNFIGKAPGSLPPISFDDCGGAETPPTATELSHLLALQYWRSYRYEPFPEWQVLQAFARMKGDLNGTVAYLFRHGDKSDAYWRPWGLLEVSGQIQVEIKYTAPIIVGEYLLSSPIYGAAVQLASGILQYDVSVSTQWDLESSIEVIPAGLDPQKCVVALETELVSGLPSTVSVSPRDQYENDIQSYGMAFVATASRRENFAVAGVPGGASFIFDSTYNTALRTYSVQVTLPVLGPYSLPVYNENRALPPTLFPAVRSVICSAGTNPNAAGTICLCNEGYARGQDGSCSRCSLGSKPKADRETGCTSCLFEPGTVSTDGLACVACPSGFRPNAAADSCVPCVST